MSIKSMTPRKRKLEVSKLSPGIRGAVVWMNKHGFNTTDSGDGTNYDDGMEGALPFLHVAIRVYKPEMLAAEADRLWKLMDRPEGVSIEALYSPVDRVATIFVSEQAREGFLSKLGSDE